MAAAGVLRGAHAAPRAPGRPARAAVLLAMSALNAACAAAPPTPAVPPVPATPAAVTATDTVLVSIADVDPTIVVEARYYGSNNFIGRTIAGYEAPKCLLTPAAARALAAAQAELREFGLGLKTYDCYRPQRAVDDFVAWARDTADTRMKAAFYPRVAKRNLFSDGYIAERSGHSRGSTVDLTLIPLVGADTVDRAAALRAPATLADCALPAGHRDPDDSLDMGTGYDCFDPLSHTANPTVGPAAARNRLLLRAVMEKHGFRNYEREWWHFTLRDEPWPATWFDRPVR